MEEVGDRPLTLKDLKDSKTIQRASGRKSMRNPDKSLDKELRDQ